MAPTSTLRAREECFSPFRAAKALLWASPISGSRKTNVFCPCWRCRKSNRAIMAMLGAICVASSSWISWPSRNLRHKALAASSAAGCGIQQSNELNEIALAQWNQQRLLSIRSHHTLRFMNGISSQVGEQLLQIQRLINASQPPISLVAIEFRICNARVASRSSHSTRRNSRAMGSSNSLRPLRSACPLFFAVTIERDRQLPVEQFLGRLKLITVFQCSRHQWRCGPGHSPGCGSKPPPRS